MASEQVYEHVLGIVMMQQYSLMAGLNKFGKEGEQAVTKELTQIHELETYVPVDPDNILALRIRPWRWNRYYFLWKRGMAS